MWSSSDAYGSYHRDFDSGATSLLLARNLAFVALLLVVAGSGTVFAVSAAVLLVSVVLIARIRLAGAPGPELSGARSQTLLAGWRAIVSEPGLRVVIGLFSAQTLVAGMFNVLVVVLALGCLFLPLVVAILFPALAGPGQARTEMVAIGALRTIATSQELYRQSGWERDGGRVRAEGRLPLDRTDFDVGRGAWRTEGTVKHEVLVDFAFELVTP